jgi:hypothetical protein
VRASAARDPANVIGWAVHSNSARQASSD